MYYILFMVFSKNVSMLHSFPDITTFTLYMTVCDPEKSFSFDFQWRS